MNKCWQEEPVFFLFLGQASDVCEQGGEAEKKGLEEGGKKC